MYKLVLIRHGESVWNKENKFTGWTDVDLSENGVSEAIEAGKKWVGNGYRISSDKKAWISADGKRQFRPPSYKPRLGKTQANFESRTINRGMWENNGHLDITN